MRRTQSAASWGVSTSMRTDEMVAAQALDAHLDLGLLHQPQDAFGLGQQVGVLLAPG